jgi:C-terminal processing protease CtpA/Prc
MVITGFSSNNNPLFLPNQLLKGDILLSVDHKSIEQIIKERRPYIPASNNATLMRDISYRLLYSKSNVINIELERNGKQMNVEVECYEWLNLKKPQAYKLLTPDIGYILPRTLNDSLSIIMDKLKNTKGIIIDLRNHSYNEYTEQIEYFFMSKKNMFCKITKIDINEPGLFRFTDKAFVGKRNKNYYNGKVVILVNETTQSNGEFEAMAFQNAPRAITIGSTTAGADGNVTKFSLPGNIPVMFSGIGIYYPDGRETQRVGVRIDKEVRPTIRGVIEGRDEVLEQAISIINEL